MGEQWDELRPQYFHDKPSALVCVGDSCVYEPDDVRWTTTTAKKLPEDKRTTVAPRKASWMAVANFIPVAGAIALHAPGLGCQWRYNDSWLRTSLAVFGGTCEGAFFIQILLRSGFRTIQSFCDLRQCFATTDPTQGCRRLMMLHFVLSALATSLLAFTIWTALLGDYIYQRMSAGDTPDMWIVLSGVREMSAHLWVHGMHERRKTASVLLVILVSVVAGLSISMSNAVLKFGGCRDFKPTVAQSGELIKTLPPSPFAVDRKGVLLSKRSLVNLAVTSTLLYAIGAWTPIYHFCASIAGGMVFLPPGSVARMASPFAGYRNSVLNLPNDRHRPNVIFLIHESLSGTALLNTDQGRNATPFFHSLREDRNMFVFEHARSVSGNTIDALTSLASGCLPLTSIGQERAFTRSIADDFARMGYRTASFSTIPVQDLSLEQTPWHMLSHYLRSSFDTVIDPDSENHGLVNVEGSDDAWFLPRIHEWLSSANGSFFMQFYTFNTHYPYRRMANSSNTDDYFASLESFDFVLQSLFEMLHATGHAQNTIIVGTGDHGEAPFDGTYPRLRGFSPSILSTAVYMYVPPKQIANRARYLLRQNTQVLVSILDIFPTLQHILYGGNASATAGIRQLANPARAVNDFKHCITGRDLLDRKLPQSRLVVSWDLVSQRAGRWLAALSSLDAGLFLRRNWNRGNGLWSMNFDRNCTRNWNMSCTEPLSMAQIGYYRQMLQNVSSTGSLVSKPLQQSGLFQHMKRLLDRQEPS